MSIRTPQETAQADATTSPPGHPAGTKSAPPLAGRASYWQMIKDTFAEWSEDRVPRLGAALAFYAFFSIGPMLYIAVFIAATVYGQTVGDEEQARADFQQQLSNYMGPETAKTVLDLMQHARRDEGGMFGTIASIIGLIVVATGAVVALKDALNTIWGVTQPEGASIWWTIRDRALSLVIVLIVGALVMVSLVLSAFLASAAHIAIDFMPFNMPIAMAQVINYTVTFIVLALLFAAVFKFLPDVKIRWRDALVGAALTAVLFLIGKALFEVYLSFVAVGSTYGSAGALAILLLFIYYSAQVFLLGGEFTQVYAREIGARIEPKRGAIRMSEAALQQQRARHKLERQDAAQRRLRSSCAGELGTTPEIIQAARYADRQRATSAPVRWAMLAFALGLGWLGSRRRKTR